MDDHTLLLDGKDPAKLRLFWISQFILGFFLILQGLRMMDSPAYGLAFLPWFQLAMGCLVIGCHGTMIAAHRAWGPKRVTFDAEGLTVKTKLFGPAEPVSWREITRIRFLVGRIEIISGDEYQKPIAIKPGSTTLGQQIRQRLREYAEPRSIEITAKK